MCYTVSALAKAELRYAKHRGGKEDVFLEIEEKIRRLGGQLPTFYHVSGFAHPNLLVFTNEDPYEPQAFMWGLVPFWVKKKEDFKNIFNKTLNARGESIFDKPSFRSAAKSKRCLIFIDSFFEYHHFGGKTYPFNIRLKNDDPMILAGLWEEWVDKETGEITHSCTIITTEGNPLLAKIHNNPKLAGPRMPVLLHPEMQDLWLTPIENESDKKAIQDLIRPYDEAELEAHTVAPLKGKAAMGNEPAALEEVKYGELEF